tara:strand:+ start:317 stop:577 length:261 start_codon:yes stop_codon:yes gene_type:complete
MKKKKVENSDDIVLQNQLFAYTVAKHYGLSIGEVLNMGIAEFRQSLSWAIAMQDRENKERAKQKMKNETGNETITLDYSFLDSEVE